MMAGGLLSSLAMAIVLSGPPEEPTPAEVPDVAEPGASQPDVDASRPGEPGTAASVPADPEEVRRLAERTLVVAEEDHTKIIGPTIELGELGYFLSGTRGEGAARIDLFVTASFEEETDLHAVYGNGWSLAFDSVDSNPFCTTDTDCVFYQDIAVALPVAALQRFGPEESLEIDLEGFNASRDFTVTASYLQAFLQRFEEAAAGG